MLTVYMSDAFSYDIQLWYYPIKWIVKKLKTYIVFVLFKRELSGSRKYQIVSARWSQQYVATNIIMYLFNKYRHCYIITLKHFAKMKRLRHILNFDLPYIYLNIAYLVCLLHVVHIIKRKKIIQQGVKSLY